MKPNIKDLSFNEFEGYLFERKQPAYRARQVWQWLYQKRAASFADMTNLSAVFREQLAADFSISRLSVERRADSADGTVKFLCRLADGRNIESVGFYNPVASGKDKRLELNVDRVNEWVGKGAQLSDKVAALVKEAGKLQQAA